MKPEHGREAHTGFVWEQSGLKQALENMPLATRHKLAAMDQEGNSAGVRNDRYQGIAWNGEIVGVVSPKYKLVQHRDAFMPVANSLDHIGQPYHWAVYERKGLMHLDVLTDEAVDGVRVGFRVTNAINGLSAIKYSLALRRSQGIVEMVGYRQVCSNGAVIRVDLSQAEFVQLEEKTKVEKLLEQQQRIIHIGRPEQQIEAVRYAVEAVAVLKDSVSRIIRAAQERKVGELEAKDLIKAYIGRKARAKVLNRMDDPSLWGLYNAVTHLASHGEVSAARGQRLLVRAADMLRIELSPPSGEAGA